MKLKSLKIERAESWQSQAGMLLGHVELVDEDGSAQRIALSPGAVGRLLGVIEVEVADTAIKKAKMVKQTIQAAKDEGKLLEQDAVGLLADTAMISASRVAEAE